MVPISFSVNEDPILLLAKKLYILFRQKDVSMILSLNVPNILFSLRQLTVEISTFTLDTPIVLKENPLLGS